MIETTTLISDVEQEFEGGKSLSVDWNVLIRRAVENVLDNIRPETLKRRVPIYGAFAKDLHAYFAPADVLVPSTIYDNDGQMLRGDEVRKRFKFVPSKTFYSQRKDNTYTIEYINGARFIVINYSSNKGSTTIDAMDAVGTKTGGTPTLNQHNFLSGTGAIQATFTDAGVEFGDDITAMDISDYLRGIALFSAYIPTKDNLVSLELRLKTDDSNYYKLITTADSIDDYLHDGWNAVMFDMNNKTEQGSPDATNITEWSIIGTTASGETMTIIFDKFNLQVTAPMYMEYYSNRPYATSASVLWQNTVNHSNSDKINFDRDVAGILHYELCLLVTQAATFDNVDSQATRRFQGQLDRKYQAYWGTHPSSEEPYSYSKSPEIDISQDIDHGRVQDDTESIAT